MRNKPLPSLANSFRPHSFNFKQYRDESPPMILTGTFMNE